jgi:hypothetical protein
MKIKLIVAISLLALLNAFKAQAQTKSNWTLANKWVQFYFNPNKGAYSIKDKRDQKICIQNAKFKVNQFSSDQGYTFTSKQEKLKDELGTGNSLVITGTKQNQPGIILVVNIYADKSYVILNNGITNISGKELRVMDYSPLTGDAYHDFLMDDFKMLDGEGGFYFTKVTTADTLKCSNNILVTFGKKASRKHAMVAGGITYNEFQKKVSVIKQKNNLQLELQGSDPVGKLVDANSTYILKDKFYIDVITDNRFEALEKYGSTLAVANHTDIGGVNFPILNFWYAFVTKFGGDEFKDNSLGTISEMEEIIKTGFLKYGPIGLRLEPDDYALPSNQQGWWDDKHWQMYKGGQLLKPFETIVKWGAKIKEMGGIPFIYCQTSKRSEDYCVEHPTQMLFNDPFKKRSKGRVGWWGKEGDSTAVYWTYDYTDPGFINHMKSVYANLKNGGVQGIKFDYPETGWSYDGGFEDKYATTTSAYRNIYKLAYDGLGASRDVQERIPPYGDIALGVLTTQRTEGDNDRVYPGRVSKTGLRWYKNRMVVNYDCDPINPYHIYPKDTRDGWRAAITMTYTTSGRMEIGKYFEKMTPDMLFDLSRAVPLLSAPALSARPIDAFTGKTYPQVYDFKIKNDWHIVTFYNTKLEGQEWPTDVMAYWTEGNQFNPRKMLSSAINISLSDKTDDGGLALDPAKKYYAFDFWNWNFIGKLNGNLQLQQILRPGEARVMAIHEAKPYPQFLSTNRHLYQGYLDMTKYPEWNADKAVLTGTSKLIAGEVYKIIIAANGYQIKSCAAGKLKSEIKLIDKANSIYEISLTSDSTVETAWQMNFNKR